MAFARYKPVGELKPLVEVAGAKGCNHLGKESRGGPESKLTMALAEKLWAMAYEDMSFAEIAGYANVARGTLVKWRQCRHCNFGKILDQARYEGRYDRKKFLNLGKAPEGDAEITTNKDAGNARVAADMFLRGSQRGDYLSPDNLAFDEGEDGVVDSHDETQDIMAGDEEAENRMIEERRKRIMERYEQEGREVARADAE